MNLNKLLIFLFTSSLFPPLAQTFLINQLLTHDIVPILLHLLLTTPQIRSPISSEEEEKNKQKIICEYCARILFQIPMHSAPDQWKGSYSDSAFCSLLRDVIYCSAPIIHYSGLLLLPNWIQSSLIRKRSDSSTEQQQNCNTINESFENLQFFPPPSSFLSSLHPHLPTRHLREPVLEFKTRITPFLQPINRLLSLTLRVLNLHFQMGLLPSSEMQTRLNLQDSLVSLDKEIFKAEESLRHYYLPKELIEIKEKIGMIKQIMEGGDGKDRERVRRSG